MHLNLALSMNLAEMLWIVLVICCAVVMAIAVKNRG